MRNKTFSFFMAAVYRLVDFAAICVGMLAAYKIYRMLNIGRQVNYTGLQVLAAALLFSAAAVVNLQIAGAYRRESSLLNVNEIKSVCKGISFSYLLFAVILYFGTLYISRYTVVLSYAFSLILVVSERTALYHLLPVAHRLTHTNKKILIYGAGELGQALYHTIVNSPRMGLSPIGFVDDDPAKAGDRHRQIGFSCKRGICVLGSGQDLLHLKQAQGVDEVWVAISNVRPAVLIRILDNIRQCGIKACFIPNLYKLFVHRIRIFTIGNLPIVEEVQPRRGGYLLLKRYFDLLLTIGTMGMLWPLLLIIGIAIKVDSKGPMIFTHERVGKDGKIFSVYKFRTMHQHTDPCAPSPKDHQDPRITKVGRFLRKTSLDELPQLLNILKGQMSLVGPRPEMPFIVKGYNEVQKERLQLLPGLTGMWQLSGDRRRAIHENMDYDLYYLRHVSFFLDIAILIETLIFAFRGI